MTPYERAHRALWAAGKPCDPDSVAAIARLPHDPHDVIKAITAVELSTNIQAFQALLRRLTDEGKFTL